MAKQVLLKSRPEGMATLDNFEVVDVEMPSPKEGEVLVKNLWMSVDPYMRGRMIDRKSYVPPFEVGKVLQGGAIGQVVASNNAQFAVGDYVNSMLGWREYYTSDGDGLSKVDGKAVPLQLYLGTLGMPGLTAYTSLLKIGEPKEGETIFVSAASGAVGSVVCQIAKIKGCRVVGSVGSDEKARWLLEEIGVDAAINYKKVDNLQEAVHKACPNGIDIYYENVGGEHLVTAINLMNSFGRLVFCGMIDQYNSVEPPVGPSNLAMVITKSLKIQGFIVTNYAHMLPDFIRDMAQWIGEGKIKWQETIMEGIENAPNAFIGLFKGENFGKMLVKLDS